MHHCVGGFLLLYRDKEICLVLEIFPATYFIIPWLTFRIGLYSSLLIIRHGFWANSSDFFLSSSLGVKVIFLTSSRACTWHKVQISPKTHGLHSKQNQMIWPNVIQKINYHFKKILYCKFLKKLSGPLLENVLNSFHCNSFSISNSNNDH